MDQYSDVIEDRRKKWLRWHKKWLSILFLLGVFGVLCLNAPYFFGVKTNSTLHQIFIGIGVLPYFCLAPAIFLLTLFLCDYFIVDKDYKRENIGLDAGWSGL